MLINVAGVAWVVRFQIVLALVLFASAVDFLVGPAVQRDRPELANLNSTVVKFGYNSSIFEQNLYQEWTKIAEAGIEVASFTKIHEYFVIFGIIFPSITGVFAGVGMSGDLKNPAKVPFESSVMNHHLSFSQTTILTVFQGYSWWYYCCIICNIPSLYLILCDVRLHFTT